MNNDECRNLRHVRLQSPFFLKPFSASALRNARTQLRYDATSNINSAMRANCQREIASNCPKETTKELDCLATIRITLTKSGVRDLLGCVGDCWKARHLDKYLV